MTLDLGALAASTASACCVVGTTRSLRIRAAAVLMVAAMVACVFAHQHPAAGLLSFTLALASVPVALIRRSGRVDPMTLHRALGGVVMAALAVTATAMAAGHAGMAGHDHGGVPLPAIAWSFTAGYVALSVWLVLRMVRARRGDGAPRALRAPRRHALATGEVLAMTAGVLLMAAM